MSAPPRPGGETRVVQVTVDCADPPSLAEFWCEVLGYRIEPPPPGFGSWEEALDAWGVPPEERRSRSAAVPLTGEGPRIFFQRVPEGRTVKNRLHLDVRAAPGLQGEARMAALQAEADRLVALGASLLGRFEPGRDLGAGHLVMADPEGNEFCLD